MKNRDMPAMPMDIDSTEYAEQCRPLRGLTKREYAAVKLLAGFAANPDVDRLVSAHSEIAIMLADKLFDALESDE